MYRVPFDQLPRDDDALHFVGSLANAHQRRVAVQPLDVELLGIAVAAVDAQRLDRVLQRRLRCEELSHAGLHVAALTTIEGLCCIECQQARRPRPRRHIAELQLDRLVFADRLAEGLAHLGVFGRQRERTLGYADAPRGDVDAAEFEAAGRLVEALAFDAADQVVRRNAVVVEYEFA